MQPKDVDACVDIVASHPVIGPRYGSTIVELQRAWRRIIGRDGVIAHIFEELEGKKVRPWGVGVSVAVRPEFLAELKKPPLSWFGPELAKRIARHDSPLLSDKQVREENSSRGLSAVTWEGCIRAGSEKRPELLHHMMSAFLESHRGYLWKEQLAPQAESAERMKWTLDCGGRLWDPSLGRYAESVREDLREVVRRPHILGVSREMVRSRLNSWVDALFHYQPPRIGFSRREQQLLAAALRGESRTDQELAAALGVSVPTVKKFWLSIYARAVLRLPELLPNNSQAGYDPSHRGIEKRRRLLAYLRDHPEELRPVSLTILRHQGSQTVR